VTPLYSTLAFPLAELRLGLNDGGGSWTSGPAWADVAAPFTVAGRCRFYANQAPVLSLLSHDVRRHAMTDLTVDHLRVRAIELVQRDIPWAEFAGYLLIHAEVAPEAPYISAVTQLGQVARPATKLSKALFDAVEGELMGKGPVPWELMPVARVASLALSGVPDEEEQGVVRWKGSRPEERRMADLLTLAKDGRNVGAPFPVVAVRPTPSYALAVSGSGPSLAILRNRSIGEEHILKLRTLWLDAFMVELLQRDALVGLSSELSTLVRLERRSWSSLRNQFREWRTAWSWQASTDHALEAAISDELRKELRLDPMLARVEAELADHAGEESLRAEAALGNAVLLLTAATLFVPLLLHASTKREAPLDDSWFIAALAVSVAIFAAVGWQLRGRRRR
jgi:hypothetical protein